MVPKPPEPRKSSSIDYLGVQRKKRSDASEREGGYAMHNWDAYGGSLEEQGTGDGIGVIFNKARQIEEGAKRKEQLMKVAKGVSIPDAIECNDMLIDAIKAKLSLLDKF